MRVYEDLMIIVNCFIIINMKVNCSFLNFTADFYKGHPPVSISTGLFFFFNVIRKICKSAEKQVILDFIIIAASDRLRYRKSERMCRLGAGLAPLIRSPYRQFGYQWMGLQAGFTVLTKSYLPS